MDGPVIALARRLNVRITESRNRLQVNTKYISDGTAKRCTDSVNNDLRTAVDVATWKSTIRSGGSCAENVVIGRS